MAKPLRRALCWLRRDLRLQDNRPLSEACANADQVAVVFVFDTTILNQLDDPDDRRVTFIHQSLVEIQQQLKSRDSGLIVLHGDPREQLVQLASDLDADAVFAGRDYEPLAVERDGLVANSLEGAGRALHLVKDQVVFEAGEVLTRQGHPFKVYTPYAKAWRERLDAHEDLRDWTADFSALMPVAHWERDWSLDTLGFQPAALWLAAGESAARERLEAFAGKIGRYPEDRDFPAREGSSGLSVHLRFGTISIRECVRNALSHEGRGGKWLSELIWREFYQDILAHHPHVCGNPFQEAYQALVYPGTEEHWDAWCAGKTGYPIVDAAMRCLVKTGWMHNRLRMIVASFLTKDLLIDYRRGEAFFARHLLDFDLASNNGGWQWAAGTGADAQPYFRIFNPISQSKKFDADGVFIRQWLPELSELDGEAIHWPHDLAEFDLTAAGVDLGNCYPRPVVDHGVQRDLAIKLLESARQH